jgi:hypothetical protein
MWTKCVIFRCTISVLPTPSSHLHGTLNIEPFRVIIQPITVKFFAHCPLHPNTLVQQIGTYTLADLTDMYRKHKQSGPKHIQL